MSTEPAKRMTLSNVVERLTERKGASSAVTVKVSAQGVFMPEITIAAETPDEVVTKMIDQAVNAFLRLHAEANGTTE
jgi:hypothetical protein